MMGGGMGGGGMGTLQALLTEISGLKKPRGITNKARKMVGMKPKPPPKYRIFMMMATNLPSVLDPALLRPGRIDRIYKVGFPTREGRARTFEGYLAKVNHNISDEQIDELAAKTPYYSGAKVKDLVNEALIPGSARQPGRRGVGRHLEGQDPQGNGPGRGLRVCGPGGIRGRHPRSQPTRSPRTCSRTMPTSM